MMKKTFRPLLCSILLSLPLILSSCRQNVIEDSATAVINEVDADNDFIELFNPTSAELDLSGWSFYKNNELIYTIPDKTVLTGGGFAVLGCKGNTTTYSGVKLGSCEAGISGKKSLLLELRNSIGERVDYFVNSSQSSPRASDYWGADPEQKFDAAGRYGDGNDGYFLLGGGTPGRTNISAAKGNQFQNTVVDFANSTPNPGTIVGNRYVFDESVIPEIHVEVSLEEWNKLLSAYDLDHDTQEYIKCDVDFIKSGDTSSIVESGIRLRGNTSRRRPECWDGRLHIKDATEWHHCHFMLNFRKYYKDDEHTIRGVRKMVLKWFKDDPSYTREMYCYDLFRRSGVWTAINDVYCRLWIHVKGDTKAAYFGVYEMMESIDKEYLEERDGFGDPSHNLWKCSWGADLKSTSDDKFKIDDNSGDYHTYELKENTENFAAAKAQLKDFITKLNSKTGDDFHTWIQSVTDIELLLKTFAVNVAVGMWDDYWNNVNNYYIYFNNSSTSGYQFFFIPYDYDNTLGTTLNCGAQNDAGRHDPLNWGMDYPPLFAKILAYDDFRKIYVDALKELVTPSKYLFTQSSSVARIKTWQLKVGPYVSNDTGEDMTVSDNTASWSSHPEYRLLTSPNNFFQVKTEVIDAL